MLVPRMEQLDGVHLFNGYIISSPELPLPYYRTPRGPDPSLSRVVHDGVRSHAGLLYFHSKALRAYLECLCTICIFLKFFALSLLSLFSLSSLVTLYLILFPPLSPCFIGTYREFLGFGMFLCDSHGDG